MHTYGCRDRKFYFPYEFIDSIEKLNFPGPPSHDAFHSTLHQSNNSDEEYALVVETWQKEGWTSLRDHLIYYNLLDVDLFVQAISNLLQSYFQDGVDLFKNNFLVSGATKLQMQKEINRGMFFCLFPKRHSDLYQKLRSQLTSELSMIFTRLAISGKTKIRPHQSKKLVHLHHHAWVQFQLVVFTCYHAKDSDRIFLQVSRKGSLPSSSCMSL